MFTPASRLVTTAVWILCKSSEASRVISVVWSWMIFGTISSTSGAMYLASDLVGCPLLAYKGLA